MSMILLIPYHIANLLLVGMLLLLLRPAADAPPPVRRGLYLVTACGAVVVMLIIAVRAFHSSPFGFIQLLAWSTFLYGTGLLGGVAVLYRQRSWISLGSASLAVALIGVTIEAFLLEPRWLEVTTVALHTAKVSAPLRIAILADIQTDRPGPYDAHVLAEAMRAQPDLILFAGDYIHLSRRSRDYNAESTALNVILRDAGLTAPLGMYAVMGNVDWPGEWPQVFTGLPVTTVHTTSRFDLGPVSLTTLAMGDAFSGAIRVPPADKFHIVLGHSPNFSLGDVDADLLIAGHTHGGQVHLPFFGPLMTLTAAPRAWASGVTEIAPGKTLIVSRGIGMERAAAPQMRFLCRPELVIVNILPQ